MLSAPMTPVSLATLVMGSLVVSYLIVFVAGFGDQRNRRSRKGFWQQPLPETLLCYLVALVAAAGLLVYFGRLDSGDPWNAWATQIIVLGLPATVGGAAGRLLL